MVNAMPIHFDDYEKHAQRLEKVANILKTDSPEFVALERAGWALAFVTMRHHPEFQTFRKRIRVSRRNRRLH
jgi:hypothetical protein